VHCVGRQYGPISAVIGKEKSMIFKGYKNYFIIHLPNQAGIMMKLFEKCLHEDDTVTSIQYKRKLNKE
jgi:hypothetical protein